MFFFFIYLFKQIQYVYYRCVYVTFHAMQTKVYLTFNIFGSTQHVCVVKKLKREKETLLMRF